MLLIELLKPPCVHGNEYSLPFNNAVKYMCTKICFGMMSHQYGCKQYHSRTILLLVPHRIMKIEPDWLWALRSSSRRKFQLSNHTVLDAQRLRIPIRVDRKAAAVVPLLSLSLPQDPAMFFWSMCWCCAPVSDGTRCNIDS